MRQVGIAALNPELPGLELTQFKAAVTLIWPFSSSARQLALLLAEPDFRLRRKKGQVRARFSGSSARAIAETQVGVGDEVILSLRGAQFVQEGKVSTPGKSIDWELSYSQTVAIRIFRNGDEIANLELVDVAPTPAPRSPVRPSLVPTPNWSSPAFMKRLRLSDGPFFEAPYDPLADDNDDGHDRKRRRKSYRDWTAWTYSARTPSPEKEGVNLEEDLGMAEASPSRQPQLPRTPVSPAKQEHAHGQSDQVSGRRNMHEKSSEQDKHVRDTTYHELYAGPDELPPSDVPYAFGGDTEVETEVNTEEEENAVEMEPDIASVSTTEANTEDLADEVENDETAHKTTLATNQDNPLQGDKESATEEDSEAERAEAQETENVVIQVWDDGGESHATGLTNAQTMGMRPPTLHTLQTDFPAAAVPGMLTPIGREPPSPTLQPLDSATLPLPSPFPGEHDIDEASSYLDHVSVQQQSAEPEGITVIEEELPEDASYIGETSFFSSINSSKASVLHPNHESAFTPVRFTFGMDGAGFSRPLALTSPVQQGSQLGNTDADSHEETVEKLQCELEESLNAQPEDSSDVEEKSNIIELSSGSEAEELEEFDSGAADPEVDDEENFAITSNLSQEKLEDESAITMRREQPANKDSDDVDDIHDTYDDNIDEISPFPPASAEILIPIHDTDDDAVSPRESQTQSQNFGETWVDEHTSAISEPSTFHQSSDIVPHHAEALLNADKEAFSELFNEDFDPEPSKEVATLPEPIHTQSPPQHDKDSNIEPLEEQQVLATGQPDSRLVVEELDVDIEDASSHVEHSAVEDLHPDIKMESIEEPSSIEMAQLQAEVTQDSPDELLITVPDEGDKIGEMHPIVVPDTAPARNTRSKTKATASPAPEEPSTPRRVTRATRSKASEISAARATLSPPALRNRSTVSPSREATQATPRSLHSHQELLSPTHDTHLPASSPRRTPRRHASQRSVNSFSDVGSSQAEGAHSLTSSYVLSQARRHSIHEEEPTRPETSTAPKTRARKAQINSPAKSDSLTGADMISPRNLRRTRHHVYDTSGEHQGPVEDLLDVDTLQGEGNAESESSKIHSSPPPTRRMSKANEFARHSPPSTAFALPHINKQQLQDSNTLITPEATQQSGTNSQPSTHFVQQQQQSLPMTPQLTQATSAGLRSQTDADMEENVLEDAAERSAIAKSTPRRNATTTDVASASASPQSPRASPTPEGIQQPSIGLSTPLAYYNPLKELLFFLNRSSHFHSSSNPDILALVASPTSTPTRATKGPKHWTTTLHITDLSSWPATTTVNIFRAYQTALPHADPGDVILLRAFAVKSLNRHPTLLSADESSWCVWRYRKPVWGHKKGGFGELVAREEMKGPSVERGEGEWREVERLRGWFVSEVKGELERREESQVKTRSKDKKAASGDAGT